MQGTFTSFLEYSLLACAIIYLFCNIMSRVKKEIDKLSDDDSMTSNTSFLISEEEIKRSRKKKKVAFQSFLSKVEIDPDEMLPQRRKLSDHELEESMLQAPKSCKICSKILRERVKVCEFCKDTMCIIHFRKARRNPLTNKFSRICDNCEDTKLMEKHFQNIMKSEETLASEELLITEKYNQMKDKLEQKRKHVEMLRSNQQAAREHIKTLEIGNLIEVEQQLDKQLKQIEKGRRQNRQLEKKINSQGSQQPHEEENDIILLQNERERIIKDLSKHRKECDSLIKAKSDLQKRMYEDLYQWQLMQKYKMTQKKGGCNIY